MRCLNEHLARRANAEDNCTGRFWQGRFESQALLDEAGLLTAMVYVDLNPIRAGLAATPEDSEWTSIYERIKALKQGNSVTSAASSIAPIRPPLRPFRHAHIPLEAALPFDLHDYLTLVDWTGRVRRSDKRGAIDAQLPPIVARMKLDPDAWRLAMRPRGNIFGRALGRLERLRLHAQTLGQAWVRGLGASKRLYGLT